MDARRNNELRPWRLGASSAAVAVLIAILCLVPLPQRIVAPVVIEPAGATRIYATAPGTLVHALAAGTPVEQGQVVARLQNRELERDSVRLQAEQQQQKLHLLELETLRGQDPALAAAIPATRESLADLEVRIGQLQELLGRLELRAAHDGVVLPPPNRQANPSSRALVGWTGTPLDAANLGCFVETGTLVCIVGHPGQVEALAVIEQSSAPLVQPGRAAWVAVAQAAGGSLPGVVEQVARVEAGELPQHLSATGALPQAASPSEQARPLQSVYQVRIKLTEPSERLLPGATGRALIAAPPETIAARLLRWSGQTFRWRAS